MTREGERPYSIALVLGGGNALGAFQAGLCEALHAHRIVPDRVVGTSIGSINGAILAGNPPERWVERLRALWRPAPTPGGWPGWSDAVPDSWRRTSEAVATMLGGRTGLFRPLGTALGGTATPAIYDTQPLCDTLAALIDFERLNRCVTPFCALAVDLESGAEALFDSRRQRIAADHIRASAAMPPTFPAIRIDGRLFVDGGLSANLPLDPVLGAPGETPLLCIAVDLLAEAQPPPATLGEVVERTQNLVFAAQSRRSIVRWQQVYAGDPAYRDRSVTLVRLAHADPAREVAGKAMDFSAESVRRRWEAGRRAGEVLAARLATGEIPTGRPGLTVIA